MTFFIESPQFSLTVAGYLYDLHYLLRYNKMKGLLQYSLDHVHPEQLNLLQDQ